MKSMQHFPTEENQEIQMYFFFLSLFASVLKCQFCLSEDLKHYAQRVRDQQKGTKLWVSISDP